jgi:hypothetical protein
MGIHGHTLHKFMTEFTGVFDKPITGFPLNPYSLVLSKNKLGMIFLNHGNLITILEVT